MSRSGYSDDLETWELTLYRSAVKRALRGKRGQAFLRELLAALDALPEKKLVHGELEHDGAYCALGAVGRARGIDMSNLDTYDVERVAGVFGIAHSMAAEIMFQNDDVYLAGDADRDARRWSIMRRWVESQIDNEG